MTLWRDVLGWLTQPVSESLWIWLLGELAFVILVFAWWRSHRTNQLLLHVNDQLIATNHNLLDVNRELRTVSDAWMREGE